MTETNEKVEPKPIDLGEYKYGFHDDVTPVFSTGKGISEDVVRAMSAEKGEPEWMLEFRLKSLETFKKMPMQEWGPDLSEIDFDDLTYFQKASDRPARDWEDVPEKIKETFERIGIPEAERAYLAGASAQYESEVVYHNMKEEYDKLGIIFTDTDSALKEYPELFKKYFSNWFHQQTINLRPLTLPSGQVVPLFMYLKASRWIFRFKPTSVLTMKQLPSLNVPLSSLMKVPAFTMWKAVRHQPILQPVFMQPSLKSLHLKELICVIQPFKTGQIASIIW